MSDDAETRPVASRAGVLQAIAGTIVLTGLPAPHTINLFDATLNRVFGDQPHVDLWFDQTEHLDRWAAHLAMEGAHVAEGPSEGAEYRKVALVHPCGWRYTLYGRLTAPTSADQPAGADR